MNIKLYLLCLFKNYCAAKGLDYDLDNLTYYSQGFTAWINENKELLNIYFQYLNELGFNYEGTDVLEVGKGKYDTLSDYGVNVASFFANSYFWIHDGVPYVIDSEKIIIPKESVILTHNPYFVSDIYKWPLMHTTQNRNISIGMYGNIDDEDRDKKVKLLYNMRGSLIQDYEFDYDTFNGSYYICTINSKDTLHKDKVKIRTR